MTWILESISAVIFLLGALIMVAAGAVGWVCFIVMSVVEYGPISGFAAIIVSVYLFARFQAYIRLPWLLWYELWRAVDARIGKTP